MSTYDVLVQVKTLLAAAIWTGGSRAFGSVFISAGIDVERTRAQLRMPWAMIVPGALEVDDESDDLVTQTVTIKIAQAVANDPYGETVLIGGAGPGTGLVSEGQGLLQLEAVLFDTLRQLDGDESVVLHWIGATAVAAEIDEEHGYIAQRDYVFEARTGAGTSP